MKKVIIVLLTLVAVMSLASCNKNESSSNSTDSSQASSKDIDTSNSVSSKSSESSSNSEKIMVYRPRFQDITAIESDKFGGAIQLIVSPLDSENTVSYIVCEHPSAIPSNEQIVSGVDYSSSMVAAKGSKVGTVSTVVMDLDEDTDYDVYITLSQNGVYPTDIYSTTVHTHTALEVLNKGNGTEAFPYLIESLEDLETVGTLSSDEQIFYKLTADIDMSEKYGPDKLSWNPIGYQTGALVKFTGNFDGDGHTISNLYLKTVEGDVRECQGLFAQSEEEAIIKNLTLTNVFVEANSQRVGALIGYNKGTISNIAIVGGSVSAPARKVGGAIGDIYDKSTITNVYTDVDVTGKENVGGIVGGIDIGAGTLSAIHISNCMAVGSVTGTSRYVGGIVGYARGYIMSQCVSMADVTGPKCIGGLIGFTQNREGNTVVPDITKSFVLGSVITITSPDDTQYKSGKVIGNPSTSNLGITTTDLYYCAVVISEFNNYSPDEFMAPISLSQLSDITFLNDTLGFRIGYDTTYVLKEGAVRPTLVVAGDYDDGSFESPLMVTSLEVTANEDGTKLNVVAGKSSDGASLYYMVKEATETAPTSEEIIAANNMLTEDFISGLTENTEYTVYVLEMKDDNVSDIVMASAKTITDELISTVDGAATLNEGELQLTVTANQDFLVYAVTSLDTLTLTKEDIVLEANLISDEFIISGLDGGNTINVYVVVTSMDKTKMSNIVTLQIAVSGTAYTPFNGDTEQSETYFPIYCGKDLILLSDIANGVNTDYTYSSSALIELKADCTLDSSVPFNSIAPKFKGVFEGNGFSIDGMLLESDSAFLGFFQQLDKGAYVQNVTFKNATVNSTSAETSSNTGIGVVAGYSKGSAKNVIVMDSSVDCSYGAQRISAFIGRVYDGEQVMTYDQISVINCTVVGTKYAGLAFGHMDAKIVDQISVTNLFVSGTITGTEDVGAIGYCRVSVKNLVADITVNAQTSAGVIGYAQNNSSTALTCVLTNIISLNETSAIGKASDSKGIIVSTSTNILTLNASPSTYESTYVLTDLTVSYLESLGFDFTIWNLSDGKLTIIYSDGGAL